MAQNNNHYIQHVCKESLEEMELFISEKVSGREINKFPDAVEQQMNLKRTGFHVWDVGYITVSLQKINQVRNLEITKVAEL